MKRLFPHNMRQQLKRHLIAVRDMTTRLQNLKRAGFVCTGAIDGGAYRGEWALEFWGVFPSVPVMLVEPQPALQARLEALARKTKGSRVASCVLSDEIGSATLYLQESNTRIIPESCDTGLSIAVPSTTIECLVNQNQDLKPNLLKLDLQGHELKALQGSRNELKRFEVIICELSIIPIGDFPIFAEVNNFFERNGYRIYDVIPQYDRPLDGALWQIDVFYVRIGSSLVSSAAWK